MYRWENSKKKLDPAITIISAILSVIAVIISIRSCQHSNEALRMSQKDFEASRKLILKSSFGHTGMSFILSPIDPEQKLQKVKIHFLNEILDSPLNLIDPYFHLEFYDFEIPLLNYLDSIIIRPDKKDILDVPEVLFPVIIVSNYIAKGENRWDTSLYVIKLGFKKYRQPKINSQINLYSISYIGILPENIDYNSELKKHWENHINHLLELIDDIN